MNVAMGHYFDLIVALLKYISYTRSLNKWLLFLTLAVYFNICVFCVWKAYEHSFNIQNHFMHEEVEIGIMTLGS